MNGANRVISDRSSTRAAFCYCSVLVFVSIIVLGGTENGAKYLFKDKFGLQPATISLISLAIHFPWYLGFLAGAMRDSWSPSRVVDHAVMVVGPIAAAGCQLICKANDSSVAGITSSLTLLTTVAVAYDAVLMARVGAVAKSFGLTGRVGAMLSVVPFVAFALTKLITGVVIQRYGYQGVCNASLAISFACVTIALWRPAVVWTSVPRFELAAGATIAFSPTAAASRRWMIVAAIVAGIWSLAPGWKTPLFFTLTGVRGLDQQQYETAQALSDGLNAMLALTYLWLCTRFRLRSLLYVGFTIGILGCFGIIFAVSFITVCIACAGFGASCGIGNAAVNDLVIRAAPKQRESLSLMLSFSFVVAFTDISDLLGSFLYARTGFNATMLLSAAIPAALLLTVTRLPASLADHAEAQ